MIKSNNVCSRIVFLLVGTIFCYLLAFSNVQAGELIDLQPADDIDYNERIRVNSAISVARSSYFYGGVHIGETSGSGGVTFINGSIVNASDGRVPVTFGDDLRVDGGIWRGPNIGAGDNLPVKISDDLRVDGAIWGGTSRGNAADGQSVVFADSVRPAMDNINTFGSSGFRWASGDFAGTVRMGNLGGDDVVNEDNLQATNAPANGQVLSYAGNNEFQWIASSDTLTSLSCTNGQIAKYNGTAWACGSDNDTVDTDWTGSGTGTMYATTTSDDVGIGITSGLSGKLHVLDSANDAGYFEATGDNVRAVRGVANNTTATTSYGGWFSSNSTGGRGVHATVNGDIAQAVYGEATSASASLNYGGYFTAAGTAGAGVYGAAPAYGGDFVATAGPGVHGLGTTYGGDFTATAGVGVNGLGTTYGGDFAASAGAGVQGDGTTHGGEFTATAGPGVFGFGTTYGGHFQNGTDNGHGVYAEASGANSHGVWGSGVDTGGFFEAVDGAGVDGESTDYGGDFAASATDGIGVRALAPGTNGHGVEATAGSQGGNFLANDGVGVVAEATAGIGVDGTGTTRGGYFEASDDVGRAVYGLATDAVGANYGGYFETSSTTNGFSGSFNGGNFNVALTLGEEFTVSNLPVGTGNDIQIAGTSLVEVGSSRRYKDNIQNLIVDTASVLDLQPVSFTFKDTGQEDIGLIAEEVHEIIPELVNYDEEGRPNGVKYSRVPVYLLEVAQEQQATIENQEERISQLESIICKYLPQEEACR